MHRGHGAAAARDPLALRLDGVRDWRCYRVEEATSQRGLSVAATAHWLGASHELGSIVSIALGGMLVMLMLDAARRRRPDAGAHG